MIVQVTSEDIARAGRSGGDNPVSRGLMRATGQAWVVFGGSIAYSRSSPHRALTLPYEVLQSWRVWMWQPFEFHAEWAHPRVEIKPIEQRRKQRRAAPRFGFDRRARDRRNTDRRRRSRRHNENQKSAYNMRASFSSHDRRTAPRRDDDAVATEITAEKLQGEL